MNKSKRAAKLAQKLRKKAAGDVEVISQASLHLIASLVMSAPPAQRQAIAGAYMVEIARIGGVQLVHMGREVPCG